MKRIFIQILTLVGCVALAGIATAATTNDTEAPVAPATTTATIGKSITAAAPGGSETNSALAEAVRRANAESAVATSDSGTNATFKLDQPSLVRFSSQRNIFNPNRRRGSGTIIRPPVVRQPRIDSFSLQGTSRNDNVWAAFFTGTSSDYRKTLELGDSIAGYKIAAITNNQVTLAAGSNKTISLPLQTQMKRSDNGPWSLGGKADPSVTSSIPASPSDAAGAATRILDSPSGGGGADNDALKRLLAKRLKDE